ncbi:MAG: sialidase-1 [Planctomycetota bacterium]|jgi:sialidase-1
MIKLLLLLAPIACPALALAQEPTLQDSAPDETTWQGYRIQFLDVDGNRASLVQPKQAAPGNPWIWRMREPGELPAFDLALLERGFHIAWIDTAGLYGSPTALERAQAFYDTLLADWELGPRAVLLGPAQGWLLATSWALARPETVAAMIGDNPVCDIKSWPAGWGLSEGDQAAWRDCMQAWGLDDEGAREFTSNPSDHVVELAEADIPVLHLVSSADQIVPPSENSHVLERRLRQVGGSIQVIDRNGAEHLPHLLEDPTPVVEFVLRHTINAEDHMEVRSGLPRFRAALAAGKAHVVFLGGSITINPGWNRFIQGDLLRGYPDAELSFDIAGVASLDSSAHAFRIDRDLLQGPPADLVILEAAVNDAVNGRSPTESIRGMEGVIRHLRQAWPQVEIALVHFPDVASVEQWPEGAARPTVEAHERVAEHYNLPSLDLSAEVASRIAQREFRWTDYGGVHPAVFGQRMVWRSMQRFLRRMAVLGPTRAQAAPAMAAAELPDAIDPLSYSGGLQLEPHLATIESGWQLLPSWAPPMKELIRPGFVNRPTLVASAPGARLTLTFEGRAIGLQVVAGHDVGAISYSLDGGPETTLELLTPWSKNVHLPWFHLLATGLGSGEHTLVITSKAGQAGGQAARIQSFLVDRGEASSK